VAIPPQAVEQGVPEGLVVQGVVPGGPAARAGLRAGDIITSIDGQPATHANQLAAVELTKRPGESVSIGYQRDGQAASATIVLGAQQ
jgi:putative serine protease PepD